MFLRVWVTLLSLTATVVVGVPSALLQDGSWGDGFSAWSLAPTLVLGNGAAWGACLLAVAVAWRAPQYPATSPMALFLCLGALAYGVSTLGLRSGFVGMSAVSITVVKRALALGLLVAMSGSLVRMAVLYPDAFVPGPSDQRFARSLRGRIERWAGGAYAWLGIAASAVLCLGLELFLSPSGQVLAVVCASLFVNGALRVFQAQYRNSVQEDRSRILWMVQGSVLSVTVPMYGFLLVNTSASFHVLEGAYPIAYALGPVALVICWTTAIFLHGAVDPALVIRRSAITGALSLLLLFLFAGAQSLVEGQISPLIGLPPIFSSAIAAGLVALAFVPLNAFLRKLADRYLPAVRGPV